MNICWIQTASGKKFDYLACKRSDAVTRWVKTPFGVFELVPGRRAALHESGKTVLSLFAHDYSVAEIIGYVRFGDWNAITEQEARELIAKQVEQES